MARKQNVRNNNRSRNKGQSGGGGQHLHRQRNTYKQHLDRYLGLAKEAATNGDSIGAEGYRQHAEHFLRQLNELPAAPDKKQNKQNQSSDTEVSANQDVSEATPPSEEAASAQDKPVEIDIDSASSK